MGVIYRPRIFLIFACSKDYAAWLWRSCFLCSEASNDNDLVLAMAFLAFEAASQ